MMTSYQRPPVTRQLDPSRVNWLRKKIRIALEINSAEVAEDLHAFGAATPRGRVSAWEQSEESKNFSPMNLAELERVLEAVIAGNRHRNSEE